jgi:hypothetical protein
MTDLDWRTIMKRTKLLAAPAAALRHAPSNPYECFVKGQLVRVIGLVLGLFFAPCVLVRGDTVLDFRDVPAGTLILGSPYTSQGFMLTGTSGGFVFDSPDTGNGSPQTVGNNAFYAGANGLAAFAPGIVTLSQTNGDPFSLLSIDLARNFAFDPPRSTTFTGMLAGGGTVAETFSVSISSPPLIFQTFDFAGFTNVTSVSWDQDVAPPRVCTSSAISISPPSSPSRRH